LIRVIVTASVLTALAAATARADDAEDCGNAAALLQTAPARAVSACSNLAERGDAHAEFMLGAMYNFGEGVLQDYARASLWYRKAADQGVAGAQYNLGVMYDTGQGVTQDHATALRLYRAAADQGMAGAQYNLALSYAQGLGVAIQGGGRAVPQGGRPGFAAGQLTSAPSTRTATACFDYAGVHMWYTLPSPPFRRAPMATAPRNRDQVARRCRPTNIPGAADGRGMEQGRE
jgi:TPR repeat protein